MATVTLVIPCYNEARRLDTEACVRFGTAHPDVRFLFVDDGSTDDTRVVLGALADCLPATEVLALRENVGKAEAVRAGVLHALSKEPDFVGFWDADLATPLDALTDFLDEMAVDTRVDMVFGARVQLLGRRIERRPARHYAGRVFATAASALLGLPVYDTQCGAKLFRVTPRVGPLFAEPFLTRWIFDVEIIARSRLPGPGGDAPLLIHEVPLRAWRDIAGSRLRLRDFLRAPFELARIYDAYLRNV